MSEHPEGAGAAWDRLSPPVDVGIRYVATSVSRTMTASWRDNASPQAQRDLDGLLDSALAFAQEQLMTRGEFFPYALAIGTDGVTEMIAGRPNSSDDQPRSADVLDSCIGALVSQRDYMRAGAAIADVRIAELGSDAIQVELEHAEGHALTVLLPYSRKRRRKGVAFGQLRAQAGRKHIWP